MNKRIQALFLAFLLLLSLAFGCKGKEAEPAAPANVAADGETFAFPENETDFGLLRTPGSQEAAYAYKTFFLPAQDNGAQPFVGDTMPYYEDGTYYIYYLKEGGDSYNHSIYLATTKDFVTYTEKDDVVLEASRSGGQDGWIGTGSVVKVKDVYYFFYTGHAFSDSYEFKEKILVAKSTDLTSFEKVTDWEHRLGKLVLVELAQEIALVLARVHPRQQTVGAVRSLLPAAVVAGGHAIGPQTGGGLQEGIELDFPIAEDIGIGRAAAGIFIEHVIHHAGPVLLAQVHEIERNADFAGHHLGHEAVFFPLAVTVQGPFRVVPVLHEHGKNIVALLLKQQSRDGRIHTSG
jgi:hypothetical protein